MTVIVIPADILAAYVHPMLDLLTGQIVELSPDPEPVQLELEFEREPPCGR